jgi:hypothetical protein
LAASKASSTHEREREKESKKNKERESFETCLVSFFPLFYYWFSFDLSAIGWFSTKQVPSSKLLPAVATPIEQQ